MDPKKAHQLAKLYEERLAWVFADWEQMAQLKVELLEVRVPTTMHHIEVLWRCKGDESDIVSLQLVFMFYVVDDPENAG